MAQHKAGRLMEMLLDDSELRRAFRNDPKAAARRAGFDLSDDAVDALSSFDWQGDTGELERRLSKGNCGGGCAN